MLSALNETNAPDSAIVGMFQVIFECTYSRKLGTMTIWHKITRYMREPLAVRLFLPINAHTHTHTHDLYFYIVMLKSVFCSFALSHVRT
jgi:hypothetical protein